MRGATSTPTSTMTTAVTRWRMRRGSDAGWLTAWRHSAGAEATGQEPERRPQLARALHMERERQGGDVARDPVELVRSDPQKGAAVDLLERADHRRDLSAHGLQRGIQHHFGMPFI